MPNECWNDSAPEGASIEEVLLSRYDTAVDRPVSVKLITYPDGTMDLFRQPGNEFTAHIAEASALLTARGLLVGEVEVTVCTGAYLPVCRRISAFPSLHVPEDSALLLGLAPFRGEAALVSMAFADNLGDSLHCHR
jgi:hypothetical protein